MKPKFIMSSGTGWSASTPLWYTLQLDNHYMHSGLKKESEYIRKILRSPTRRFEQLVEKRAKQSKMAIDMQVETINKHMFLNQEDKDIR